MGEKPLPILARIARAAFARLRLISASALAAIGLKPSSISAQGEGSSVSSIFKAYAIFSEIVKASLIWFSPLKYFSRAFIWAWPRVFRPLFKLLFWWMILIGQPDDFVFGLFLAIKMILFGSI
jgi:hypothetical protein